MGTLVNSLGAIVTGVGLGIVKAVRGNKSTELESGILFGVAGLADYFTYDQSIEDFLRGVEATSVAVMVTEMTNQAHVARQVWVPAQQAGVDLG